MHLLWIQNHFADILHEVEVVYCVANKVAETIISFYACFMIYKQGLFLGINKRIFIWYMFDTK